MGNYGYKLHSTAGPWLHAESCCYLIYLFLSRSLFSSGVSTTSKKYSGSLGFFLVSNFFNSFMTSPDYLVFWQSMSTVVFTHLDIPHWAVVNYECFYLFILLARPNPIDKFFHDFYLSYSSNYDYCIVIY
nr:MAG TPA: hypothetical protein [Caudoviricetes sp.]